MEQDLIAFPRHLADESHALFAIARYIDALRLNHWSQVLLLWLGQYDGLERYLDPSESPAVAVRELLARYVANGQRVFPKTIAMDLAALPFLHYRARLLDDAGTEWSPLDVPFIEFAQSRNVAVWYSESPSPNSSATQSYLLSSFMRQQTTTVVRFRAAMKRGR